MPQDTDKQIAQLKSKCNIAERSENPVAKVSGLAYLVISRPDPEAAARFFIDYGLVIDRRTDQKLYLRGTSNNSHLVILKKGPAKITTVGFTASPEDLEKLATYFHSSIITRDDAMGGRYIALTDPDGLALEINTELQELAPLETSPLNSPANGADEKVRLNEPVRNKIQPRTVARLGHTVWSAKSMLKTIHWYQDVLGFIVSDFQFVPNDANPIVAFMRCDNGDTPTDHHTLGIGSGIELGHVHSAFEMDSYEDVAIANQWMSRQRKKLKYIHGWGIGRHILGSQIFDYWRDRHGDLFEHYADGDLFDSSIPTGYHLFSGDAQHQWGPDITPEFVGMKRPIQMLKYIFKRLPTSDDLTIGRLLRMLKAV